MTIGERITGKLCKKHPELNGERFLRNRACPLCQNGYTKQRNQLVRDNANKFNLLKALVLEYLDEPTGLGAIEIRRLLK